MDRKAENGSFLATTFGGIVRGPVLVQAVGIVLVNKDIHHYGGQDWTALSAAFVWSCRSMN